MKFLQILAIFSLLCAASGFIWSLFYPLPLNPYETFLWLIGASIWTAAILWAGFDVFWGSLPLVVRLLFLFFCALIALMDIIKAKSFTLGDVWSYAWVVSAMGYILTRKRGDSCKEG